MNEYPNKVGTMVAGELHVSCSCCPSPQTLLAHPSLDATRLFCPNTHLTYLDRGDGLFEQDGSHLPLQPQATLPVVEAELAEPDVLSDRPRKTGPKTRIMLERATFA
jgi:hypothetical protein